MPLFTTRTKTLVGMVHVQALPGSPRSELGMEEIIAMAVRDAEVLRDGGIDGILVENMHDRPYLRAPVPPETVAGMAVVARAVKEASGLPCGVQVLAGANREALAVALVGGLDFVRVEGFVFAHVADEGVIESDAGELLRYQKQIGALGIAIYADVKKKHASHALTGDLDIEDVARAAEFFLADGVIVTGARTGKRPTAGDLEKARKAGIPVIVGSGVTVANAARLMRASDGLIVGSALKEGGKWENPVDPERVAELVEALWG